MSRILIINEHKAVASIKLALINICLKIVMKRDDPSIQYIICLPDYSSGKELPAY